MGYHVAAADLTHGPMLGAVTQSGVRVWGRTSGPANLQVRFGTEFEKLDATSTASTKTQLEHDFAGWLSLEPLKPDARYYFQFLVDGRAAGEVGSFRTLPAAADYRHAEHNPKGLFNFRFEFGSCANQNPEHGIGPSLPTYDTLVRQEAENVHFAIMNGDWLYEELRGYSADQWRAQVGVTGGQTPTAVRLAPSIAGVWENYKLYMRRAPNLMEWHRRVPSYFTFDDHELVNDIRGCATVGFRERRTVFRDIGIQAWHDYLGWANPIPATAPIHFGQARFQTGSDILVDSTSDFTNLNLQDLPTLHVHWGTQTAGENDMKFDDDKLGDPNSRVYQVVGRLDKHRLRIQPPAVADSVSSYSIGRRNYTSFRVANCEYYLLDLKTYRQMHDPKHPAKPGLTMLGQAQKRWLLESMQQSSADFFFIVSSNNFMIPHDGAGGFEFAEGKDDAWTALLDEREQMLTAWEALNKPVFILTADLHNSFAIKITDRIWEFASGPHNSVNHVPANDEGGRPATGLYKSGSRVCDIRWSTYIQPDLERLQRLYPMYCVAQVNNVYNMPKKLGDSRWVAYPHPQIVFQYFDGRTGQLRYAESISVPRSTNK